MTGRMYTVSTPRPKGPHKPGESWWLRVGTAWQNEKGLITVYLDSYPVPDEKGVVKMMLFDPPDRDAEKVRTNINKSMTPNYAEDLDDQIPF